MLTVIVAAALVLAGAGCDKYARLTQEQKDICAAESQKVHLNYVGSPEGGMGWSRVGEQVQKECLESMVKGRTYHLVKYSEGEAGARVLQEQLESLKQPYYILDYCKNEGFPWQLTAMETDRRAYYECRTTCKEDRESGGITCEGTVYTSPRDLELWPTCKPEQRDPAKCRTIYHHPVCAFVNIQCDAPPCTPIKQTFADDCEACQNPLVSEYDASGPCSEEKK